MSYRENHRDLLANLGGLLSGLAQDAQDALRHARMAENEPLDRLIERIDTLRYELRDRTSTPIYGWLLSLRALLDQEITNRTLGDSLEDGEGSGYFDPNFGVRIG